MPVIAKMGIQSIEDYGYNRKFKFTCVHDSGINTGDSPENRAFTKATPSGEAWMTVDNKNVWNQFHAGGEEHNHRSSQHYVVFIDADKNKLEDVYAALSELQ